jgi:MFS family permease
MPVWTDQARRRLLSPWRFVLLFGLVSLLTDMVYEGARSIIGPYLATLGASAAVVGLVAGAGDFLGYSLRVVSGYLVQRRRRYWTWTMVGYALTIVSVPLIGATHALAPALVLYATERLGKAVRSPAKDTLLSHASTRTGRGRAFGVHQAMDQTGAMAGPLLLAAVLSAHAGNYQLAFATLAVPGVIVVGLLFWLRWRVPHPGRYEGESPESEPPPHWAPQAAASSTRPASAAGEAIPPDRTRLPPLLWRYIGSVGVISLGVAPFPLLALHAQGRGLLTAAQVPLLFAVAMAVDGATGLLVGRAYDRTGASVLILVPVSAAAAAVSFTNTPALVWAGVAVWGLVNGILDSTVKAVVTDLVPGATRASAFGWLALSRGVGLLLAGALLGLAYEQSSTAVIGVIVAVNVVALIALASVLRALPHP